MKCGFCGKEIAHGIKIKKGHLCEQCQGLFPKSIQGSFASFTVEQLKEIKKAVFEAYSEPLYGYGSFAVAERSVQLNNFEYPLHHLIQISLAFHPIDFSDNSRGAKGWLTVVLTLKDPGLRIEEPVFPSQVDILYTINGRSISYLFPSGLSEIVTEINRTIESGSGNMKAFFHEKKKEEKKKAQEEKASQKEKYSKQEAWKDEKLNAAQSPLERAQILFGVQPPYTQDDIRKIRRRKLQSDPIHPDNGGTAQKFEEFNNAYHLLLKFATNTKC